MVFSSHLFIFWFLPLALGLYYAAGRRTWLLGAAGLLAVAIYSFTGNPWNLLGVLPVLLTVLHPSARSRRHDLLTLLSYTFYGWANPIFVVLMLFSTIVDYICGLIIVQRFGDWRSPLPMLDKHGPRTTSQRVALTVSIVTNLALLGFFKYFNFGIDSWNATLAGMGIESAQWDTLLRVTLPLGISFYTFQSMSYSIDVYRGDAKAIRNFNDFACYVSMFPQLVAGPIIRFQEVDAQLRERTHTMEKFARGAVFFCTGTAKKILIANPCGKIADTCFDAGSLTTVDAWQGGIAYAFQIYFDFSAYSDMAIGLGLMMGFVFPKNFDSPYHSQSITEFWRRWHISLSTWLRDYLYIPLGGNRFGPARTYINLALVMLLGGMWHGASVNFIVWGAIHGSWLAFERMQGKDSFYRFLPGPVKMAITFVIVCIAWVFFRAATLSDSTQYLAAMFGLTSAHEGQGLLTAVLHNPYYLGSMVLAGIVTWTCPQTWDWSRRLPPWKLIAAGAVFVFSLVVLETQSYNPFIYFIF